ncbi:hypothetical protein DY000_02008779 [Brassica cretica]|uniref:Uncharacterized protein n=1 Tax=Brassica cretica TaxID=69181 RepID=A0ABQ7CDD5_BRACR|nr:hypothetical protein DY000_02008779 [Brassica cretica]
METDRNKMQRATIIAVVDDAASGRYGSYDDSPAGDIFDENSNGSPGSCRHRASRFEGAFLSGSWQQSGLPAPWSARVLVNSNEASITDARERAFGLLGHL